MSRKKRFCSFFTRNNGTFAGKLKIIMMKKMNLLLMAIMLSAAAFAGNGKTSTTLPVEGEVVKASHPMIQYMGRVSFGKNPDVASFNFPGTTIEANFQGSSLKMMCRPMTGYFMAQVDGSEPFKVGFNAERDSVVTLATALPKGVHHVKVMYVIEGLFRNPEFRGFVLDKGCKLVEAPALSERKIEFIGNSITCGYGVESIEMSDPFEDETENHWLTYANIVSDSLKAQHTSISRSGIGVYRNYDGPKTGSAENMPWQYEYTLFNKHDEKWDFAKYQPQLVCINLGTNDLSTDNYDIQLYEKNYRMFLTTVRSKYPDAKIVLLTGPMLGKKESSEQRAALDRICADANKSGFTLVNQTVVDKKGKIKKAKKLGDKEIYRFDFTFQKGDLGYGASWHPSKLQHQKMAKELLPFLKNLMNW